MSGDDYTPRPEPAFRPAGPGHTVTMRCGKCGDDMPNLGRRQVKHRGVKVWAGKCCQKPKGAKP